MRGEFWGLVIKKLLKSIHLPKLM